MVSETITKDYHEEANIVAFNETLAIKVLLVENNEIVRRGLQALLTSEPDIKLVGEASDKLTIVKMMEELRPDVLVVDSIINGMGLATFRYIARELPKSSIIIYSTEDDDTYVLEAMRLGVKGYVLKGHTADELIQAIHEVAEGYHYLSRPLRERAIKAYLDKPKTNSSNLDKLNLREKDIILMISQGLSSNEIGKRLRISIRTVECHRLNVRRKLGIHGHGATITHNLLQNGFRVGIMKKNSPEW